MIFGRTSEALVETNRASRYLTQLGKHFTRETNRAVRVHVDYDDEYGVAHFGWVGTCTMQVQPRGLLLRAEASDPVRLQLVQRVMASHLERFGRRHGLVVRWTRRGGDRTGRSSPPAPR